MPRDDEDSYLSRRLLTPPPSSSGMSHNNKQTIKIENETIMKKNNDDSSSNTSEGDLRLHDAVICDSENFGEIIRLLEENPNLLYEKDDEERTPLHTLSISGDERAPQIAKLLLGFGEGPNGGVRTERESVLHAKDHAGFTPLHYAARNWFPELTDVLLKCGAKVDAFCNRGNTPLHYAAEGSIEKALECARVILEYDNANGSLINKKNLDELAPLHKAVKEQAVEMTKLLLQKEYKLDLSLHVNASGQTILHYLCLEAGETEKSCEILEQIMAICTPIQLNQSDENGRTVLHLAAIERHPKITDILVRDERVDILIVDKRSRLAIHYASENGAFPDGYRCVESLISRKFKRSRTKIQYLYETNDDMGCSSFMYACLNCPVETMQKYLSAIPEPQFWLTDTNITLLYKQSPLSVKALMDSAFTQRKRSNKSSDVDVIVTDFGSITGYTDPVEKLPQQETKYLKNAQWWDYEIQKEILMHPLVQLFCVRKCQKLRSIIYGWILCQLIWLMAYTLLVLTTYCNVFQSSPTAIVASIIIVIYLILSTTNEVFEFCSVGLSYIWSLSNVFQLVQIGLGVAAITPVIFGTELSIVHRNCAATGILLAWILLMRDAGKLHEEIGLIIEVLKQVVIQIVKVLCCCSQLLVGFTLAFVILFDEDGSFPGPLGIFTWSLRVLVMMTGEFEFNDTFKDDGGEGHDEVKKNRAIRLLIFLSFLILIPVAFFNLLTGFALDKVMELRERAKVGRISKQLEHIYFIESILLSLRPLRKFFHGSFVRWIRKYNVTSAVIDGDLKFETFLNEVRRKKIDRRTAKEKKMDVLNVFRYMFGTELPEEVRHQIFALASRDTSEKEQH